MGRGHGTHQGSIAGNASELWPVKKTVGSTRPNVQMYGQLYTGTLMMQRGAVVLLYRSQLFGLSPCAMKGEGKEAI